MRKFLVLASASFLSAGISHAQELPVDPADVFTRAISQAETCEPKTLKVALDNEGRLKGQWDEDNDDDSGVLEKLVNGDRNYLKALTSLRGRVYLEPSTKNFRRIEAALPQELPYGKWGMVFFRLRILDVVLEQALAGERWLPTLVEVTIKYWKGFGFGITTHDKYRTTFDCSTADTATK